MKTTVKTPDNKAVTVKRPTKKVKEVSTQPLATAVVKVKKTKEVTRPIDDHTPEPRTLGTSKGTIIVPETPAILRSSFPVLTTDAEMDPMKLVMLNAPVPKATDSYAPVAHADVLNSVYEQLDKQGYKIRTETFNANKDGQQVICRLGIESTDSDLGMMLCFRNSYDKSMSVGFAAGSQAWICSNGMVSGEITMVRKHTGSVVKELEEKIQYTMNHFEEEFNRHLNFREVTKQIEVSKRQMAELAGRIFIEEQILNLQQLNIMKEQILGSKNFVEDSAWSIYNHATEALKICHSAYYLRHHIELHQFFEAEYELGNIVDSK